MRVAAVLLCLAWVGCGGDDDGGTADAGDADSGPGVDAGDDRCETDSDCDDGTFCNGVETCSAAGLCQAAVIPRCDDSIDCTEDACSEATSGCAHTPPDADEDGHADAACLDSGGMPLGDDCDDTDATRHPGASEVCDPSHDEDCDVETFGTTDLDGDTYVAATCCNLVGSVTRCGDDCDDAVAGTHPSEAESCNGIDDDCDGMIDDIRDGMVVCAAGESVACVTACGLPGARNCDADCLSFEACAAPEVCNGCDDDLDARVDNGFECAAMALDSTCTTMCGSAGSRRCSASCTYVDPCLAPGELCNYCDDNGDGNINAEFALMTESARIDLACWTITFTPARPSHSLYGSAECVADPDAPPDIGDHVRLLPGLATGETGAYWLDVPMHVGVGRVVVDITVQARMRAATGWPLGGWAIVLASGGTGDLGPATRYGIPTTRQGISLEWSWSDRNTSPFPGAPASSTDALRYRSLTAGPRGRFVGESDGDNIQDLATHLDEGDIGWVTQRLRLEYTADRPDTAATNEERIVTQAGTIGQYSWSSAEPPPDRFTTIPSNDLPVASSIRLGITAGSLASVGPPPGGPSDAIIPGAPVEARVFFRTTNIPSGPPVVTQISYATAANICTGDWRE